MLNILLVDDEEDFLKVIKKRMESWEGIGNVFTAANGKEALAIIDKGGIDIVVLDYLMPVMDGVTTLREIRNTHFDMKVIMFTAYPADDNMQEAMKMRVDAFIPKYSDVSDVQTSLKAAVFAVAGQMRKNK